MPHPLAPLGPRPLLLTLLLAASPLAQAHDTWFAPLPDSPSGAPLRLTLGTGNRFPVQEFNPQASSVVEAGCRSASGQRQALQPTAEAATHLEMRVRAASDGSPTVSCWAQLKPFELTLSADKVAEYFREIRPSDAVRQAWRGQQRRGIAWQERYTKYARVELTRAAGGDTLASEPSPLGMDAVLLTPRTEVRPGATLSFLVLRDGQPLADFPVELVSERQRVGIWRQTDARGQVSAPVPLAGQWLLRGTHLAPSSTQPDGWESAFLALTFEVPPPR